MVLAVVVEGDFLSADHGSHLFGLVVRCGPAVRRGLAVSGVRSGMLGGIKGEVLGGAPVDYPEARHEVVLPSCLHCPSHSAPMVT